MSLRYGQGSSIRPRLIFVYDYDNNTALSTVYCRLSLGRRKRERIGGEKGGDNKNSSSRRAHQGHPAIEIFSSQFIE